MAIEFESLTTAAVKYTTSEGMNGWYILPQINYRGEGASLSALCSMASSHSNDPLFLTHEDNMVLTSTNTAGRSFTFLTKEGNTLLVYNTGRSFNMESPDSIFPYVTMGNGNGFFYGNGLADSSGLYGFHVYFVAKNLDTGTFYNGSVLGFTTDGYSKPYEINYDSSYSPFTSFAINGNVYADFVDPSIHSIYYHGTNVILQGSDTAAPGTTVVVRYSVNTGYVLGDPDYSIRVEHQGESLNHVVDTIYQTITFTMPEMGNVDVYVSAVPKDPYSPGGDSEPGAGEEGSYENPTDVIPLPDLPINGVNHFVRLWNPSNSEVEQLSAYLFSTDVWDSVKRQLLGNPIQYIVSFGLVPAPISIGSVKENFTLGYQTSDITMYGVGQQYVRKSLGTVTIPAYWQSFMDYEPHTKIQVYLPYIGYRDVLPSEVIGKAVEVVYHIDYFSGSCVAFLVVAGSVLYQFNGNCLATIPFASNEFGNLLSGSMGAVGGFATGMIALTGGFAPAIGSLMALGGFGGAFSSVLTMGKESVNHGGNVSATNGLLSSRKPYFILNRPQQAVAENQNEYHGFATWYKADDFRSAHGYVKLAEIHLHDIPATDWEIKEIERLLKEGVIF